MMDPLTAIGGLATALQLVTTAAQALLATIRLTRGIKVISARLALLLGDVEDSISRLCHSCNAGSELFQNMSVPRLDRLSRSVTTLHPALEEIHSILKPLIDNRRGRGASLRGLWQSFVMLDVERELSEKLARLNRLNLEMIREIGMLGLEVQVDIHRVIVADNAASRKASSNIEAKMDALHDRLQEFTISVHHSRAVLLEKSEHFPMTSGDWNPLQKRKLIENSPFSSPISDNNSAVISEPSAYNQELVRNTWLSHERAEEMHRYLSGSSGAGISITRNELSSDRLPHARLEFILFNIRTFYTTGNFEASSTITKPGFWKDTNLAIYLMKVSTGAVRGSSESQTRGLRLLKKLTAKDMQYQFEQSTDIILVELLSTLSPANTSTCPYARDGLLRNLSQLAHEQLPRDHPIALVIDKLKDDNRDNNISIRALTFIVERLRSTIGPIHALTQLATHRLLALLRRNGDHSEALRLAGEGSRAIRTVLGPGSLQERLLLRRVEHVKMDQGDWAASLGICFDIVGQRSDNAENPDPSYHDECAVWTMEDIAKTCECAGNVVQAIAWLKQARISGGILWGKTEAVGHIQDKLFELLRENGRVEESEVWSKALDAEAGG